MIQHYCLGCSKEKPFYSVKLIFQDHWKSYRLTHTPRQIEIEEVEKMLSCKSDERGCFVWYCKNCNEYHFERFGCNSRLCSPCGKRYTDEWAKRLSRKIAKNIIYRHIVFTLPAELWQIIKENRELQKVISDVSYRTIQKAFSKMKHVEKLMPGVIAVVHPFGKDIEFKPHTHCLVTEGGFNQKGKFIHLGEYIPYELFHLLWQEEVLNAFRKYLPKEKIDYFFKKYPKGFYVYVKPERIHSGKGLIEYIGRYIRHPAIANSRIDRYNGEVVRFFYEDHERKIRRRVMKVFDFISAIIQHIPEKHFRLVRYYGVCARRKTGIVRSFIQQSIIPSSNPIKNISKRSFLCPKCHNEMEFVMYRKKPPPKDKNKITTWLEMRRLS